jgi:hypothetical protein
MRYKFADVSEELAGIRFMAQHSSPRNIDAAGPCQTLVTLSDYTECMLKQMDPK